MTVTVPARCNSDRTRMLHEVAQLATDMVAALMAGGSVLTCPALPCRILLPPQPHPAMAAVPAPAAVPVGMAAAGGSSSGKPSRSRGDSSSSPAVHPAADHSSTPSAAAAAGYGSSSSRMPGGYDPQQQQAMRGGGRLQVVQQQYMQLQQQGSGPDGGSVSSPVAPEGPTRTLYIGNIANTVDESALQHTFGAFGPIVHIQVRFGRARSSFIDNY